MRDFTPIEVTNQNRFVITSNYTDLVGCASSRDHRDRRDSGVSFLVLHSGTQVAPKSTGNRVDDGGGGEGKRMK